jgi:hypothetical protein
MAAFALAFSLCLPAIANAQVQQTDWTLFNKALVRALRCDNCGARMGAIQQIAYYGSYLDVQDGLFDVVKVYRNSKNENQRILALSALAKMRDPWAMDFLARSVPFEKSARVRRHTIHVVNAYRLGTDRPPDLIAELNLPPPSQDEIDRIVALIEE